MKEFIFIIFVLVVVIFLLSFWLAGFIDNGGDRDDIRTAIIVGGLALIILLTEYWMFFDFGIREPLGKTLLILAVGFDGVWNSVTTQTSCQFVDDEFIGYFWHLFRWLSFYILAGWMWFTVTRNWKERLTLAFGAAIAWTAGLYSGNFICNRCWCSPW